ncbi:hypothetical protein ABZ299_12395 [Streptomyces sp. NPDC006184]|uniref:hypothetical protein n=1 Tax=Streptomyces sp. NPDC006184 TaxID=3155455 RepID=UPI0033A55A18
MTSHVEDQIQARIAAARRKAEADHHRRQELAEARQHGLAARHAQKLRRLAEQQTHAEAGDDQAATDPRTPAADQRLAEPKETPQ